MTNLQVAKMALFSRSYHFLSFVIYVCDFPDLPFFLQTKLQTKMEIQNKYFVFFFQALAGQESSKARLMGNAPPRAQLRDADQNQDGMLSLAEFREAWKKA